MNEKDLQDLTEKARVERFYYRLHLDNLITSQQLENGVIIERGRLNP